MSTLAERVEWILKHRRREGGRAWSARALSDAAGLAPAHVGMMRRGDAKDVRVETLGALAKAAGVSLRWLATGDGSPDADDDTHAPSATDDETPIMANAQGWEDTCKVDRAEHADITDEENETANKIARYAIHRPAVRGDLWRLVQMIRQMNDPVRLAVQLAESDRRLRAAIEALPEQARREQEALAKKAAKHVPKSR